MKELIIMNKLKEYSMYQFLRVHDYVFAPFRHILSNDFRSNELINWFFNEKRTITGNEYVDIHKENNKIVFYDISDSMCEEYSEPDLNPDLRFEMSRENFIDLLYHWEELRVSLPDTILIVIHEDNYVTLETDPVIIKQYQDAGYAFDIDTKVQ
ncbi:hypothetical protein [Candidatus Chromulinivorax destructor]|uniref:Uncharacterized protein n=1 Tax=Candidatus Chromulinivorax destructor TaxID=2066483 RepID=A0A345ZAN1_9BACT|nr:hypothetical protein [Candidatus Chromulinivorax destructor]AXK60348.1 hypothetical protein C0J27_01105 [Candidatus Chromulinivorax destructor]